MEFPAKVRELAELLYGDLSASAHQLAEHVRRTVPAYVDNPLVPADELERSCRENLAYVLRTIAGRPSGGLAAAHATGARRAEAGVSYAMVVQAYRAGTRHIWDEMVGRADAEARREMFRAAADMWAVADAFTSAAGESYTAALLALAQHRQELRSALVNDLLDGTPVSAVPLSAGEFLGLAGDRYVVVAAETTRHDASSLSRVLTDLRVRSGWRRRAGRQDGIVALPANRRREDIASALTETGVVRGGVSREFVVLAAASGALHQARLALATTSADSADVVCFGDRLLATVVASESEGVDELLRVLRPVLAHEEVLTTLRCWYECGGSTTATAEATHMHRNTVRARLERAEGLTGLSTSDPKQSAVLFAALEAARIRA